MHAVGQALVQQGRTEEGMSLLDEAMAGVIGGEGGDPMTVAQMSCMTMVVCGICFDLERATQWVQSLQGFIDRYGCPFLYAECRTYYGHPGGSRTPIHLSPHRPGSPQSGIREDEHPQPPGDACGIQCKGRLTDPAEPRPPPRT